MKNDLIRTHRVQIGNSCALKGTHLQGMCKDITSILCSWYLQLITNFQLPSPTLEQIAESPAHKPAAKSTKAAKAASPAKKAAAAAQEQVLAQFSASALKEALGDSEVSAN